MTILPSFKADGLVWFDGAYRHFQWRQLLLLEETGGSGENHRPVASH